MSSAKGLEFDVKPVNKLLMQTKNNKRPRIELWETQAFTAAHPED